MLPWTKAKHCVPMGAHLVHMGAQCRSNGRPWAQNVWLCHEQVSKLPRDQICFGVPKRFVHASMSRAG